VSSASIITDKDDFVIFQQRCLVVRHAAAAAATAEFRTAAEISTFKSAEEY
jgi:hypothetical protein